MSHLADFSETETHPLSFVAQVRREVAGRVMTDFERRLRDANGRCATCGGPLTKEPHVAMRMMRVAHGDDLNVLHVSYLHCCWCGLEPTE